MPCVPVAPWMVFLLFLTAPLSAGWIFQIGDSARYLSWQLPVESSATVQETPDAGIRDTIGLRIIRERNAPYSDKFHGHARFASEFWLRFILKSSRPIQNKTASDNSSGQISLFFLSFADMQNNMYPNGSLRFSFNQVPNRSSLFLESETFISSDKTRNPTLRYPLSLDSVYCIESHQRFFHPESMTQEWFINGIFAGRLTVLVPFQRSFIDVAGGTMASGWQGPCTLLISDFAISDKRSYVTPPRPVLAAAEFTGGKVTLRSAPFVSFFKGEDLRAVEWRLFRKEDGLFPVLDVMETDPVRFHQYSIPFPLDSGTYYWRTRWKNNFHAWSHFSRTDSIQIKAPRPIPFRIAEASVTMPDREEALKEIRKDQWYRLRLALAPANSWVRSGYFIVVLRHSDYPYGNPGNKGEKFQPQSNYIMNLSRTKAGFALFEKNAENSSQTQVLDPEHPGLYTDAGSVRIDTVNGILSFNFKLLDKALSGEWQCLVYGRDSLDELSNIHHLLFQVSPLKPFQPSPLILIALFLTGLAGAGVVIGRRRKRHAQTSGLRLEEPFNAIRAYMIEHLPEKLTIDLVRKDLGININRFYEIMKANNAEFPKLLNQLRIEKAKELLLKSEVNISTVGFDVGFNNPSYFSQIFREQTGRTPGEFRKANLPDR